MPALVVALSLLASAADLDPLDNWPHWRGPTRDGFVPRGDPPLRWDDKTNVAWKTPIPGRGSATPIVWGERIFVLTAVDTGQKADPKDLPRPDPKFQKKTTPPGTYHRFIVLALDRKTGKVIWEKTAAERVPHEGHHESHSYAAGSPVTDGKRLYVSFGSFGVYCYDFDGNLLWHRDLPRLETRLGWGEASTPLVHDGKVYLNWDQEGPSALYALEAATGKTEWKADRDEVSSWATPLVVTRGGKTRVIMPGTRKVRCYDAESGKELWTHDGLTVNCIPTPVIKGDVALVLSGYGKAAGGAYTLDGKQLWKFEKGTPYVPSPALAGDRLWFTLANVGLVSCVDVRTGKPVIDQARLNALRNLYASPVVAAGRVYIIDREGTCAVLKQADKLEVLAVNRLGEPVDASPVVVGKQLLLRGDKHLWCIEEK
jgi:outer membrane protein assembly factor BamB